mmetsp:Transcript_28464/g.42266  ORF Transcript_28464/g.42266 Transcript_28464/m.42266 type:complete len:356 (-) Transcript_28464:121-1188(-)
MTEVVTISEQKAMAIAPKVSSTLSFIACTCAAVYILRNPLRRSKTYHRLVLAMCLTSLPSSIAYFWGTWAIPAGTRYAIGASGNVTTCNIQGATIQLFDSAALFYYAALGIYSFLSVHYDFSTQKLIFFERAIHFAVFLWPIVTSVVGIVKNLYTPGGSWCSTHSSIQWQWIMFGIPLLLAMFISIVSLGLLYWAIKNKMRRGENLTGKQLFLDEHRQKKSWAVLKQASVYLAAFCVSYLLSIVSIAVHTELGMAHLTLQVISNAIIPLHGFIYVLMYIRLLRLGESNFRVSDTSHRSLSLVSGTKNNFEMQSTNNKKESLFSADMSDDDKWEVFGVYVGGSDDEEDEDNYVADI